MTNLDAFNSFLRERLFVVAEEIYHAVRDIVSEQLEEVKRAREEIFDLRRALDEARLNTETDAQTSHTQGSAVEQWKSKNEQLTSESSLIQVKLELCAVQQEDEPQLRSDTSTCSSSSSTKKSDTQNVPQCLPPKMKEIAINLVPCDAQLMSGNFNSSVVINQSVSDGCGIDLKEEEVHQSPYCGTSFTDISKLEAHMESNQSAMDPFHCQICGKNFKQRVNWKNHMIVHQKTRPFRCKFCSKGFNQKGHLKEHERIHTGEKPFGCLVCGKHFTQFNHVRAHLRNHHQDKLQV